MILLQTHYFTSKMIEMFQIIHHIITQWIHSEQLSLQHYQIEEKYIIEIEINEFIQIDNLIVDEKQHSHFIVGLSESLSIQQMKQLLLDGCQEIEHEVIDEVQNFKHQ